MKKNITINLSGRIFQIDEDACDMLQHYIDSLRSSFGKQEGGDEIVDDIEARIAELFDELRAQGTEAITITHVKDIITRIGRPEELTGEDGAQNKNSADGEPGHHYDSIGEAAQGIYNNMRERTAGKKLFRNPKDKILAGVLSGFAAYTNTDPVIWRLATMLLLWFYGAGLWIYLILAIVLPEARTPEQLLQMEGKEVTPQNLADVVVNKDNPSTERPSLIRDLFSQLLKLVVMVLSFFVSIVVIIGFLSILVVIVSALILPVSSDMPFSLESMGLTGLYESNPLMLILFAFSLLMLLFIPIYAIIHMMLSLSGKTKSMGMTQRITWIVLWIAALCCVIPCSIATVQYSTEYTHHKFKKLNTFYYQGVEMSKTDADFLRKGGWNLLQAVNCDHYSRSGEYFDGNHNIRYLGVYNPSCEELFQAERKEKVKPGLYSLSCNVRAEGTGTFIYAIGNEKLLKEILAYGNKGGELWESIARTESEDNKPAEDSKAEPKWKQKLQHKIAKANHEQGYGWSSLQIDSIVVTTDSIAYGVSTDNAFTGQPCRAQWLSATDFKLTRIGNLPKKPSRSTR